MSVNNLVSIFPSDVLRFRGNIATENAHSKIKIKNLSPTKVFFKIKSTKPDRYCVSPPQGILDVNNRIKLLVRIKDVTITKNDINLDKFLLQFISFDHVEEAGNDPLKAFLMADKKLIKKYKILVNGEDDEGGDMMSYQQVDTKEDSLSSHSITNDNSDPNDNKINNLDSFNTALDNNKNLINKLDNIRTKDEGNISNNDINMENNESDQNDTGTLPDIEQNSEPGEVENYEHPIGVNYHTSTASEIDNDKNGENKDDPPSESNTQIVVEVQENMKSDGESAKPAYQEEVKPAKTSMPFKNVFYFIIGFLVGYLFNHIFYLIFPMMYCTHRSLE